jgi:hypothetical protein
MSNEEHFSGLQSAVSSIQAENISIGDINQSIINSSNSRYNHVGVIITEYNKNVARSERSFRDKSRANQKNMHKELQNCLQDLNRQTKACQKDIEEHEKKIKEINKYGGLLIDINEEIKDDLSSKNKKSADENVSANGIVISGYAAYMIYQENNQKKESEAELEETKRNISELKYLIPLVEGFLRASFPEELNIDQILDDPSLENLSPCVRESIQSIKHSYRSQQDDLKDSYNEDLNRYKTDRNISIYREELHYCIDEDGYPLSSSKIRLLESRLRSFNLDQEDVESITEEIVKPLSIENLMTYEAAYQEKLHKEGYPLSEHGATNLQKIKESLGLNAFSFLQLDVRSIERRLVKPFYQTNFREYQKIYKVKLEEKGLMLEPEDFIHLDKFQVCLGLKNFTFEDFDIKNTEQESIKLVYRENIQKYEQEYKRKLSHEHFPLSLKAIHELSSLEETLGLGHFQFPDCSDPVSIKRELVEPLYHANLQSYGEEYKRKLYQFGINFSQKNTSDLHILRKDFGLDVNYLENLGLQSLFSLEEINKIETNLIELVYHENLQRYEQEYKQKLEKEGFFLSYSTISELTHLEEILGLESFKVPDYPDLKSIKAQWLRPFYQVNLQDYSKEYKRKIYQLGLSFSENHKLELEKLRSSFGLTSTHLKNLNLQGQFFLLESELLTLEKIAKELFYIESLQCYVQELKRERESDGFFAEQDSNLKKSLQTLGIRSEDIKIATGLIRNDWEIEHLFYERDSDVSYWKLINSLAQCEWQKADALTRDLLLKLADRSGKGFLDKEAIEKIPVRDVYTLDLLWVEYSKGHFGFSIQKKIFERVDRKKQPCAEAVGWSNQAGIFKGLFAWKSYDGLDFTLNAPQGHLPVWRVKGKEISVDDFSHLTIWDFKENEPQLKSLRDTDSSKPDSSTTNILSQSFQKVFESINQFEIKQKVDKMGIDGFINQCALLAATTGAASGFGGFATMIVGVPFDVLNNVLQQFRVTLGIIYYKKGIYKVSFAELITIVGVSIGVEVGATLTKSVMINIANKILVQLSASTAGKAIPFLGAAIGGSVNYGFVRAIGAAVKRIDMSTYTFQSEGEGHPNSLSLGRGN